MATIYILERLQENGKWLSVDHSADFQKMAKQCDRRKDAARVIPRGPKVKHEVLYANCERAQFA